MSDFTTIDRDDFRNLLDEIGRTRMPFGKFGIKAYPPSGVPGGNQEIRFTTVPEPSAAFLAILGTLPLLRRRW